MNLPSLSRRQQLLLACAAVAIAGVQVYQLVQQGIEGASWVLSFTVAALLVAWCLQGSSVGTSVVQPGSVATRPRRRFYLVVVLLAGAILTVFTVVAVRRSQTASVVDQEQFEKALRELERESKPVATISLDALLAEYRDNEIEAAAKYGCSRDTVLRTGGCGRVIETSADIEDIGRDPRDVPFLRLATTTPIVSGLKPAIMRSIEARFSDRGGALPSDETALRGLRRGQRVTLRCSPLYNANQFTLVGCAVVQ